ncbi:MULTISPECIES: S26 family signal peptidase [unclassified Micromonospora]|uniref:S26 family signal peptidase n=1 Tax=unclassified Micromonospora TaxID=2617518 RepID=UPI001B38AB02|nr:MULTISPECIES: S26 family signal peptidase [unclassified Micromonospora]MBQ1045579.1 S26 family signal peptidase [Micromonospora sp. C72]MBQ1058623.1 S26 family signal peptidase [Micromonospora sp. C32]
MTRPIAVVAALVAAVAAPVAVVWWLRERYVLVTVHGESMLPTYRPGDRVLVRRVPPSALRTGQVVVAGWPGERQAPPRRSRRGRPVVDEGWLIKRIAALPGDPAPPDLPGAVEDGPPATVPPGLLVLIGDNRAASHDSRQLGYFAHSDVLGVVKREVASAGHRAS